MNDLKKKPAFRFMASLVILSFITSTVIPQSAYAQVVFNLPQPGQMVGLSDSYIPAVLKGVAIHSEDPLLFDFVVDNGQTGLTGKALTDETTKLVKYFIAGLAVPEKELWVNLSPTEKDRIMPDDLSHTDVGKELLAQDYILKQITSSLMYPEKDLGRKFWAEIYSRAYTKFGNTNVPVDSFNKVWIMPDEATVYQNGNNAFVAGAHLKVMLESDYDAAKGVAGNQVNDPSMLLAKDVIREVILPVLEKEVNEGRNFANLRQVFQSLILSGWYKKALQTSLLNQVYANSNKVDGITIAEQDAREKVYAQYMAAYQKGVYNYIKEEFDHNKTATTPKRYFSGGVIFNTAINIELPGTASAQTMMNVQKINGDSAQKIEYKLETQVDHAVADKADASMGVVEVEPYIKEAGWKKNGVRFYGPDLNIEQVEAKVREINNVAYLLTFKEKEQMSPLIIRIEDADEALVVRDYFNNKDNMAMLKIAFAMGAENAAKYLTPKLSRWLSNDAAQGSHDREELLKAVRLLPVNEISDGNYNIEVLYKDYKSTINLVMLRQRQILYSAEAVGDLLDSRQYTPEMIKAKLIDAIKEDKDLAQATADAAQYSARDIINVINQRVVYNSKEGSDVRKIAFGDYSHVVEIRYDSYASHASWIKIETTPSGHTVYEMSVRGDITGQPWNVIRNTIQSNLRSDFAMRNVNNAEQNNQVQSPLLEEGPYAFKKILKIVGLGADLEKVNTDVKTGMKIIPLKDSLHRLTIEYRAEPLPAGKSWIQLNSALGVHFKMSAAGDLRKADWSVILKAIEDEVNLVDVNDPASGVDRAQAYLDEVERNIHNYVAKSIRAINEIEITVPMDGHKDFKMAITEGSYSENETLNLIRKEINRRRGVMPEGSKGVIDAVLSQTNDLRDLVKGAGVDDLRLLMEMVVATNIASLEAQSVAEQAAARVQDAKLALQVLGDLSPIARMNVVEEAIAIGSNMVLNLSVLPQSVFGKTPGIVRLTAVQLDKENLSDKEYEERLEFNNKNAQDNRLQGAVVLLQHENGLSLNKASWAMSVYGAELASLSDLLESKDVTEEQLYQWNADWFPYLLEAAAWLKTDGFTFHEVVGLVKMLRNRFYSDSKDAADLDLVGVSVLSAAKVLGQKYRDLWSKEAAPASLIALEYAALGFAGWVFYKENESLTVKSVVSFVPLVLAVGTMIWRKYQNIRELNRFKSEVGFSIGNMVDDTSMEAVNDAAQVGVADKGQIQGGIDLGNGDYLKVITTDAAGMPKFDPAQVQMLQKNLRGIIPVPVGMPQPVNLRPMLGLAPDSGKENIQVGSHKELSHEYLARRQDEVEQEVLL